MWHINLVLCSARLDHKCFFQLARLVIGGLFVIVCLFVCLVNCFDVASVACSLFAQFSYEGL